VGCAAGAGAGVARADRAHVRARDFAASLALAWQDCEQFIDYELIVIVESKSNQIRRRGVEA